MTVVIAAALAAVPVSFFAGLLVFKIKQRWCPTCGATLTCPDPTYHHDESDR